MFRKNGGIRHPSCNLPYLTDTGDRECIKQVIDTTKPEVVIPIHTEVPEAINELTDKAIILKDMEIYEVKEQNMEEPKTITYEEVEQRLKNVKLEDYTKEDVFDRYVGYGDTEDFENVEVQKLLLKYNLVEELIYNMGTIITDNEVIRGILESNILKDNRFICINGKIEKLEFIEDRELKPMGMCYMIIYFTDNTNNQYRIKHIYYGAKEEKYKNEIEQNIGTNITVITEKQKYDNNLHLCCFMKNEQ